jgi:phosphohistidine phosphatase
VASAKRIYLVRHAKAEEQREDGDAARRLTRGGRERFEALLALLGPRLAVRSVVTSPFLRARETAAILARATGAEVEEDEALSSGRSSGREILALARRAPPGTALVGHNPELGEAIALAAGRQQDVKPGTVAALDLGDEVTLAWLERPPRSG